MNTKPWRKKTPFIVGVTSLLLGTTINSLHAAGSPANPDYPRAPTLAPAPGDEEEGPGPGGQPHPRAVPDQRQLRRRAGEGAQYILNVQPVIPIALNEDWNLTTGTIIPIITVNSQESAKEAWVIPVGGGLGRIVRIGKLPPNCHLGACWNVRTPTDGPDWQLRAQIQVMFPK